MLSCCPAVAGVGGHREPGGLHGCVCNSLCAGAAAGEGGTKLLQELANAFALKKHCWFA